MATSRGAFIRGLGWAFTNQGLFQGINFIISIYLTRLLAPQDYGIFGISIIIINFLNLFNGLGLNSVLIMKQKLTESEKNTVFWTNIFFGIITCLLICVLTPFLADFYYEKDLLNLNYLLSISLIIYASFNVQSSLLNKELQFKKLTLINAVSTITSGSTAIYFAILNYGVYALASQFLINCLCQAVLTWLTSNWRPSFKFSIADFKSLWTTGKQITLNNGISFLDRSLDFLVLGKVISSASLGIYSRSKSLVQIPLNNISNAVSMVLFPTIASFNNDNEKVSRVFTILTSSFLVILTPVAFLSSYFFDDFVFFILGQKWADSIEIYRILNLVGVLHPINALIGSTLYGTASTKEVYKVSLKSTIINILFLFFAVIVSSDILVITIYLTIGSLCGSMLLLRSIFKILASADKSYIIKDFIICILSSAGILLVVQIETIFLSKYLGNLTLILIQLITIILAYAATFWITSPLIVTYLKDFLKEKGFKLTLRKI